MKIRLTAVWLPLWLIVGLLGLLALQNSCTPVRDYAALRAQWQSERDSAFQRIAYQRSVADQSAERSHRATGNFTAWTAERAKAEQEERIARAFWLLENPSPSP